MAVTNGQLANQTTFNAAFMSRTQDTSTVGKVDLDNADTVSGDAIENAQREFNSMSSFVGKAINLLKDALPSWTSGAPDSLFARVDALSENLFDEPDSFIKTLRVESDSGNILDLDSSVPVVVLPGGSLNVLSGIVDGENGKFIVIINASTVDDVLLFHDDPAATVGDRLLLPSGDNITLAPYQGALLCHYGGEWRYIGGSGSGGGVPGPDSIDNSMIQDDAVQRENLALGAVGRKILYTKTSNHTVVFNEDVLRVNAGGGAITITLDDPTDPQFDGHEYTIIKADSSINVVLVTDGTLSWKLCSQSESITMVSDGVSWYVMHRYIPSSWTQSTIAFVGSGGSNPSKGTVSVDSFRWRRVGPNMEIVGVYSHTTTGSAGTGNYVIAIPGGRTVNTSLVGVSTSLDASYLLGYGDLYSDTGAPANGNRTPLRVIPYSTTQIAFKPTIVSLVMGSPSGTQNVLSFSKVLWGASFAPMSSAHVRFDFYCSIPITDWEG